MSGRWSPENLGRWARMIGVGVALGVAPLALGQEGGGGESQDGAHVEPPGPRTDNDDVEDPLPTLDELLGLEGAEEGDGGEAGGGLDDLPAARDPSKEELDRRLSGREAGQRLEQAVELMEQTATRLTDSRDASVMTQRLQEDVLRKLDQVIEAARQNQSGSSSSSSSASSRAQRPQPQQGGSQRRSGSDSDSRAGPPPARRDGELAPAPAGGATWGSLPPRVREALMEGLSDPFSAVYRSLTESYYKRLAEEGSR